MRIIGINSSHDTSLCIMEDGEVKELFEEERERRDKYYSPNINNPELHVVDSKGVADALINEDGTPCGELIFASFDRRICQIDMDKEYLMENRLIAEEVAAAFAKEQLSLKRLEEISEEFPKLGLKFDWHEDMDEAIHDAMCKQFHEVEEYHFDIEHHMYPTVPFYNLPKLHKLIKSQLPRPNESFISGLIEMIPAIIKQVHDGSGAGDTVISTFALCDCISLLPKESAYIANIAASIVCEKPGVVPITIDLLIDKAVKYFK